MTSFACDFVYFTFFHVVMFGFRLWGIKMCCNVAVALNAIPMLVFLKNV